MRQRPFASGDHGKAPGWPSSASVAAAPAVDMVTILYREINSVSLRSNTMLSFRNRLIVTAILAPLLCAFLYWIDSDPPYPNVWHTVREFILLTVIICFPITLLFTTAFAWFFRKRTAS